MKFWHVFGIEDLLINTKHPQTDPKDETQKQTRENDQNQAQTEGEVSSGLPQRNRIIFSKVQLDSKRIVFRKTQFQDSEIFSISHFLM